MTFTYILIQVPAGLADVVVPHFQPACKSGQPRGYCTLCCFVLKIREILCNKLCAARLKCCYCKHRHLGVYLCSAILVSGLTLSRYLAGFCNIAVLPRHTAGLCLLSDMPLHTAEVLTAI